MCLLFQRKPSRRRARPSWEWTHLVVAVATCAWLVVLADAAVAQAEQVVDIRFVGNEEFDDGRLLGAFPISFGRLEETGSAADMFDVAVDVEAYHQDRGFPHCIVVPEREVMLPPEGAPPATPVVIRVTFRVDEGPRIEVVEVRFVGNSGVFAVERLRGFFGSMRLGWFRTGPAWYSQRKINDACADIEQLYLVNGFLDAGVRAPTIENGAVALDRHRVRLLVRIDEGPQYFLRRVSLAGVGVDDEQLLEVRAKLAEQLRERVEESEWLEDAPPYTASMLVALSSVVASYFRNRQHFAVTINEQVELEPETGAVHVSFVVTPGPRYRVGHVRFANVEQFREGFLRSIIPLRDGEDQPYSLELEQETFQALMRTGLIQQLNVVTTRRVENGQHYVDYTYEVEEAPSIDLQVMIGYGSYELLRGIVDLAERNVFGIGRTIGIRTLGSFRMREVMPRFTDPWTLGGDWPYTVSGFYRWRREPGFTTESFGGTVTLSHRISAYWRFSLAYQLERSVAFDIEPGVDVSEVDRQVLLGALQPRLTFDTRDSFFDPHSGLLFSVGLGLHSPWLGGDVAFLQVITRVAAFAPLVEGTVVLAVRYEFGVNWNWRGERIPLQERFFNGGSETVRSYRQDQLLRPDETGPQSSGGLIRNVFSFEIRHQIIGPIWGGVFVDIGNLVGEISNWFDPDTFRFGVGYGLRFITPIGPLRLDFAWNPDRRDDVDEDQFVLHLSIGYSF